MTHALKTWPDFYKDIESGEKTFELRKNDRNFKMGETLLLQEYEPSKGYTGKESKFTICYILSDAERFGLKKGFVILGLKENEYQ